MLIAALFGCSTECSFSGGYVPFDEPVVPDDTVLTLDAIGIRRGHPEFGPPRSGTCSPPRVFRENRMGSASMHVGGVGQDTVRWHVWLDEGELPELYYFSMIDDSITSLAGPADQPLGLVWFDGPRPEPIDFTIGISAVRENPDGGAALESEPLFVQIDDSGASE